MALGFCYAATITIKSVETFFSLWVFLQTLIILLLLFCIYFATPLPKPMLHVICTDLCSCTTLNRGAGGLENHPYIDALEAAETVKYHA